MNLKIDVNVKDAGKIKTLIELLASRLEELPDDLAGLVLELADDKEFEINPDTLHRMGVDNSAVKVYVDGKLTAGICAVNKILRRVSKEVFFESKPVIENGAIKQAFTYPEHCKVMAGDVIIMEW